MEAQQFPESRIRDLLARRGVDWTRVLRIVEVGSTAHGISSPDTGDDFDATVVRMESWQELVVGANDRQSMMVRTQPDGVRSRMGDIDLNVYTLRKFGALASKGNPSILGALFSPLVHKRSHIDFDKLARIVASKRAAGAFLGYMSEQLDRWVGARGQKSVTRPELVEQYGFDTKYAAHVVRLGLQGREYLETGRYSMPMGGVWQSEIISLRTGGYTEREALAWAHQVEEDLKAAIDSSPLPEKPGNWRGWVADQYAMMFDVDL